MKSTSTILMVALLSAPAAFSQAGEPKAPVERSAASTPTSVSAPLDACGASGKRRQRFTLEFEYACDVDSLFEHPSQAQLSGKQKHFSRGELRHDGTRLFFSNTEWAESENEKLAIAKDKPKQRTWLWDGKVYYVLTPGISAILTVGQGCLGMDRLVPTAIPRGYLCEMDDPVDLVVRRSKTARLRPKPEMIDGFPCVVIEASGKEGQLTLWIDTQRGNNLVKAEVHLTEGNLLRGKPLEKGYQIDGTLNEVHLKEIDGTWFPISYAYDYSQFFPTGHFKSHAQCSFSRIKVNPDFDALLAFVPSMIEEGLRVKLTGDKSKKRYTWHKGEILDEQGQKTDL